MRYRRSINTLVVFLMAFVGGLAAVAARSQEPPPVPAVEEINEGAEARDFPAPPPNAPPPRQLKALVDVKAIETTAELRPLFRAELHLIHNVCKTTNDEQRALARASEPVLKRVAYKTAEFEVKMGQGWFDGFVPDVVGMIQNGLAAVVSVRLSRRQTEDYQAEVGRRARDLRDIVARNVVARFDGLLCFDENQRGTIAASLANSQVDLSKELDAVLNADGEFPTVPEAVFAPHLEPRAWQIWKATQNNESVTTEVGIIGISTDEADFAEEDDPVDAAKEKIRRALSQIIQHVSAVVHPPRNARFACILIGD